MAQANVMPKRIVHVNQLVIRGNAKRGERNPPLSIRGKSRNKKVVYCHEAVLMLSGEEVGRFVYRPDNPLDCGAKVWFETDKLQVVPLLRGKEDSN